ncbi:aminotransferase class V-fold PLP-dependent enzyme [Ferrimonas sediminicola]|uniref:Aminotransferase class V-fold PLP-dependent enzyme n=1 Tax=Ferrimonas sediminicola TaxID=2569538 RepID=A0A4U1BH42_9GAMM|nr:aminotransferase class V-fold PLP-dependent enzyme [Ferrimonas sediminicola]TKB50347.1 aminotransferase class V-fold PLP-dependent enzyme [Ferrimonas sediminicola]
MTPWPVEPVEGIYLQSHSVGRPWLGAQEAVSKAFFQPWREQGEPWAQWLAGIERFNRGLASLIGGAAEQYCPQVNLSSALTKLLGGLTPEPARPVLLMCEEDFPSMVFVARQAESWGWQLRLLPGGSDVTELATWQSALSRPDVGLVFITQVQSNTGQQAPVAEICALARGLGVRSVVDVAQSMGILPMAIDRWQADAVIGSCVKWIGGGPGAGFIWLNPDLLPRLRPRDVGWFSHANPFEFDPHDFRYHPDAARFWGGTPSVIPYLLATHALECAREVGLEAIRDHNLALADTLMDACPSWVRSPREAHRRGGTVIVDPGERTAEVERVLTGLQVHYDRRGLGLRLSPHLCNTREEISRVAETLSALAGK